jgi:hypothetical protein
MLVVCGLCIELWCGGFCQCLFLCCLLLIPHRQTMLLCFLEKHGNLAQAHDHRICTQLHVYAVAACPAKLGMTMHSPDGAPSSGSTHVCCMVICRPVMCTHVHAIATHQRVIFVLVTPILGCYSRVVCPFAIVMCLVFAWSDRAVPKSIPSNSLLVLVLHAPGCAACISKLGQLCSLYTKGLHADS